MAHRMKRNKEQRIKKNDKHHSVTSQRLNQSDGITLNSNQMEGHTVNEETYPSSFDNNTLTSIFRPYDILSSPMLPDPSSLFYNSPFSHSLDELIFANEQIIEQGIESLRFDTQMTSSGYSMAVHTSQPILLDNTHIFDPVIQTFTDLAQDTLRTLHVSPSMPLLDILGPAKDGQRRVPMLNPEPKYYSLVKGSGYGNYSELIPIPVERYNLKTTKRYNRLGNKFRDDSKLSIKNHKKSNEKIKHRRKKQKAKLEKSQPILNWPYYIIKPYSGHVVDNNYTLRGNAEPIRQYPRPAYFENNMNTYPRDHGFISKSRRDFEVQTATLYDDNNLTNRTTSDTTDELLAQNFKLQESIINLQKKLEILKECACMKKKLLNEQADRTKKVLDEKKNSTFNNQNNSFRKSTKSQSDLSGRKSKGINNLSSHYDDEERQDTSNSSSGSKIKCHYDNKTGNMIYIYPDRIIIQLKENNTIQLPCKTNDNILASNEFQYGEKDERVSSLSHSPMSQRDFEKPLQHSTPIDKIKTSNVDLSSSVQRDFDELSMNPETPKSRYIKNRLQSQNYDGSFNNFRDAQGLRAHDLQSADAIRTPLISGRSLSHEENLKAENQNIGRGTIMENLNVICKCNLAAYSRPTEEKSKKEIYQTHGSMSSRFSDRPIARRLFSERSTPTSMSSPVFDGHASMYTEASDRNTLKHSIDGNHLDAYSDMAIHQPSSNIEVNLNTNSNDRSSIHPNESHLQECMLWCQDYINKRLSNPRMSQIPLSALERNSITQDFGQQTPIVLQSITAGDRNEELENPKISIKSSFLSTREQISSDTPLYAMHDRHTPSVHPIHALSSWQHPEESHEREDSLEYEKRESHNQIYNRSASMTFNNYNQQDDVNRKSSILKTPRKNISSNERFTDTNMETPQYKKVSFGPTIESSNNLSSNWETSSSVYGTNRDVNVDERQSVPSTELMAHTYLNMASPHQENVSIGMRDVSSFNTASNRHSLNSENEKNLHDCISRCHNLFSEEHQNLSVDEKQRAPSTVLMTHMNSNIPPPPHENVSIEMSDEDNFNRASNPHSLNTENEKNLHDCITRCHTLIQEGNGNLTTDERHRTPSTVLTAHTNSNIASPHQAKGAVEVMDENSFNITSNPHLLNSENATNLHDCLSRCYTLFPEEHRNLRIDERLRAPSTVQTAHTNSNFASPHREKVSVEVMDDNTFNRASNRHSLNTENEKNLHDCIARCHILFQEEHGNLSIDERHGTPSTVLMAQSNMAYPHHEKSSIDVPDDNSFISASDRHSLPSSHETNLQECISRCYTYFHEQNRDVNIDERHSVPSTLRTSHTHLNMASPHQENVSIGMMDESSFNTASNRHSLNSENEKNLHDCISRCHNLFPKGHRDLNIDERHRPPSTVLMAHTNSNIASPHHENVSIEVSDENSFNRAGNLHYLNSENEKNIHDCIARCYTLFQEEHQNLNIDGRHRAPSTILMAYTNSSIASPQQQKVYVEAEDEIIQDRKSSRLPLHLVRGKNLRDCIARCYNNPNVKYNSDEVNRLSLDTFGNERFAKAQNESNVTHQHDSDRDSLNAERNSHDRNQQKHSWIHQDSPNETFENRKSTNNIDESHGHHRRRQSGYQDSISNSNEERDLPYGDDHSHKHREHSASQQGSFNDSIRNRKSLNDVNEPLGRHNQRQSSSHYNSFNELNRSRDSSHSGADSSNGHTQRNPSKFKNSLNKPNNNERRSRSSDDQYRSSRDTFHSVKSSNSINDSNDGSEDISQVDQNVSYTNRRKSTSVMTEGRIVDNPFQHQNSHNVQMLQVDLDTPHTTTSTNVDESDKFKIKINQQFGSNLRSSKSQTDSNCLIASNEVSKGNLGKADYNVQQTFDVENEDCKIFLEVNKFMRFDCDAECCGASDTTIRPQVRSVPSQTY